MRKIFEAWYVTFICDGEEVTHGFFSRSTAMDIFNRLRSTGQGEVYLACLESIRDGVKLRPVTEDDEEWEFVKNKSQMGEYSCEP